MLSSSSLLFLCSICLLDEPSNHLDNAAKKWLARYLATYEGEGALILVTHDSELLKSMDHIAEIVVSGVTSNGGGGGSGGSLQIYKSCNYEQYLQLKEERAKTAMTTFEKNAEKAAKLQAFVDRFGASANKASAAQSRVKQIERMEREGLLDAPPDALVAKQFKPTLVLPEPPKAIGETLLSLKKAGVGYENSPLVEDISLTIRRGMKVLVRYVLAITLGVFSLTTPVCLLNYDPSLLRFAEAPTELASRQYCMH